MKKFLSLILLLVTITTFIGCDKDDEQTLVTAEYSFILNEEVIDTIYVEPQATTISFGVKSNIDGTMVDNWQLFQVAEYDFTAPVEARPWNLITMGIKSIDKPVDLGWATIQKRYTDGKEMFRVDLQVNNSSLKRSYRISVGKRIVKGIIYIAQVVIVQEADAETAEE